MLDECSVATSRPGIRPQPPVMQAKPWFFVSSKNFRYFAVAGACAIVNNLLLIGLVKAGFNYFAGIWIAYVPMVLFGYALHVSITFRVKGSSHTLLRYALVMLANYPLWIASLVVLCGGLKMPITLAAPVGTVIAFIGNYLATHWAIMRSIRAAFVGASTKSNQPVQQDLLTQFVSEYGFQPATALWRAIELPALIGLGVPEGRGIDVGCGDGKLTAILFNCIGRRDLVGIDPDPREVDEARRREIYMAVHACGGNRIPEPDASFDFAISNSVLEHIPDLDPVLAETARVLRADGLFLLTVPHAGFHAQLRGPLVPGIRRTDYEARLDRRLAHLRYPTAADWQTKLAQHGFITEEIVFYLDRRQVRRWETISRFTAGVLSALTGGAMHPIAIQRQLGLREFQNRRVLPLGLAAAIAAILSFGTHRTNGKLTEENSGCIAIRCRRRQ